MCNFSIWLLTYCLSLTGDWGKSAVFSNIFVNIRCSILKLCILFFLCILVFISEVVLIIFIMWSHMGLYIIFVKSIIFFVVRRLLCTALIIQRFSHYEKLRGCLTHTIIPLLFLRLQGRLF
jgi:hypothetical protein